MKYPELDMKYVFDNTIHLEQGNGVEGLIHENVLEIQ